MNGKKKNSRGRVVWETGRHWGEAMPLGVDIQGLQWVAQLPRDCRDTRESEWLQVQRDLVAACYRYSPQGLSE